MLVFFLSPSILKDISSQTLKLGKAMAAWRKGHPEERHGEGRTATRQQEQVRVTGLGLSKGT